MTLVGPLGRRRSGLFARSGAGRRRGWFGGVDKLLWWIPLAMIFVAGILIASTQRQAGYADWHQHWVTAAVGVVIALQIARVPVEQITRWQWPIYGAMVASLIAVRIIGVSALGAQSWISIGGFNVQPSEFAKVAAILLLAGVLSRYPVERPVDLVRPIGLIALPWALVFIQPDLGTSLVYMAICLAILWVAGQPITHFWLIGGILVVPVLSALTTVPMRGMTMPTSGRKESTKIRASSGLTWRSSPHWCSVCLLVVCTSQPGLRFWVPWKLAKPVSATRLQMPKMPRCKLRRS